MSWVFDDSRELSLNIRNGTRAKAWLEMLAPPDGDGGMLLVAGFDARRYIPLVPPHHTVHAGRGQHFLWRARACCITSVGCTSLCSLRRRRHAHSRRKLCLPNCGHAHAGFRAQVRNGTSFAVAMPKCAFPSFATLSPEKSLTPFMEHFQAVGFL